MGDFGAPLARAGQALFTTLIALVCTISILKKKQILDVSDLSGRGARDRTKARGHGHSQSLRDVYAPNFTDGMLTVMIPTGVPAPASTLLLFAAVDDCAALEKLVRARN
jgi:hypothetical protein